MSLTNLEVQMFSSLKEKGFWVGDSLFSSEILGTLLGHAQKYFEENHFKSAQVGRGSEKQIHSEIRRDKIFWIEDWTQSPFLEISQTLHSFIQVFRQHLYLPVKSFEGHLAHYSPGDFYVRHVDRHKGTSTRVLSLVLYLNDVEASQGGSLILFEGETPILEVEPKMGKMIIFDSEIPHEVKATGVPRWSLTLWYLTT